jgi:hypothetical protein
MQLGGEIHAFFFYVRESRTQVILRIGVDFLENVGGGS